MTYTHEYGKIAHPPFLIARQCPGSNWPRYEPDPSWDWKVKAALQNRWLIVHIQNAFDGWPPQCTKYSLYMDNYGQVWKIYTEHNQVIEPCNSSQYPLTDALIDLAKKTMAPWIGQMEFRGEGIRPPRIPPKDALDSFVDISPPPPKIVEVVNQKKKDKKLRKKPSTIPDNPFDWFE